MKGKKAKTFLLFPFGIFLLRTVAFAGFVLSYSGGTARELHPLPIIHSAYVFGECRRDGAALSRNRCSGIVGRHRVACFNDPHKPAIAIHPHHTRSSWTHRLTSNSILPGPSQESISSSCLHLTILVLMQAFVDLC